MAHTPGPWRLTSVRSGHKGDIYAPKPGAKYVTECHWIARCFAPKPDAMPLCDLSAIAVENEAVAQIEANARLISLAPEMLEALEAFQQHVIRNVCTWVDTESGSHHHPIWQKVADVIARAKGGVA